jgi:hypothetical protein
MLAKVAKKRASPEQTLQNHRPTVSRNDTADAINLAMTAITKMIEAHTVLILFLDNTLERMLHAEELFLGQVTFKHAELNALAEIFQDLMNTIPPLIIMDVIRDDQVHV